MYKSFLLSALCITSIFAQAQTQFTNNVGIGINPTAQFHTTGTVRFQGMTGTGNRLLQTDPIGLVVPVAGGVAGQVLTQGANGLIWTTPTAANFWNLTGNTGNAANHFFGTTDNKPIIFKTNSLEQFRIRTQTYSTFLMSNYATPTGILDNYPIQNLPYLGLSMDIQRKSIDYGKSIGLSAVTEAAGEGTAIGIARSSAANIECWAAGGGLIGIVGSSTISKIAQSEKNFTSGGGLFWTDLTNATVNIAAGETFVGGSVSHLMGSINPASNTKRAVFAAVIGDDKINNGLTWAAYLKGKTYVSDRLAVGTTMI